MPMRALARAGILDPRQLDQDLVGALARDRGLGHAELIDAVADRLQPLADGVVAELLDLPLDHHEREATGRLVLIAVA